MADKEGVRITRPYKKADLRIRDLDDSVCESDIINAIAVEGNCPRAQIKVGEIRKRPGTLGTAWVQCPLAVAKKIIEKKRLSIGWL